MMYIRMGPKNKDLTGDGEKTHLHVDGILLWSRADANHYISKLERLRDTLWPVKQEEEKQ